MMVMVSMMMNMMMILYDTVCLIEVMIDKTHSGQIMHGWQVCIFRSCKKTNTIVQLSWEVHRT